MKRKKPKRQRMARKTNPILAAIELSARGQRRTAIMDGWHTLPRKTQLDIIREFFSSETISEVGTLVLESILTKDKRMIGWITGAIKAGDHLFNRDRELELLRPALRYRLCNWDVLLLKHRGNSQAAVDELKRGIEQHCNHGRKLLDHQWKRLRPALMLQERSSVRLDRKPAKLLGVNWGDVIVVRGHARKRYTDHLVLEDYAPPLAKKRKRRTSDTKKPKSVF